MIIEIVLREEITENKVINCGFVKSKENSNIFTFDVMYYWNEEEREITIRYRIDLREKKLYLVVLKAYELEINKAFQLSEDIKQELVRFEKMKLIKTIRYR